MSTTDDLNISKKELTTKNTEKSTMWAVRVFADCVDPREKLDRFFVIGVILYSLLFTDFSD